MKQAKVLDDAEIKRVLAVAAQGKHAARNRLALLLSHYAGLRVGEIATLCWADVLGADGEIKQQFYLKPERVIPPFLTGLFGRIYAAIANFWAGVMPPMPILGRSLL